MKFITRRKLFSAVLAICTTLSLVPGSSAQSSFKLVKVADGVYDAVGRVNSIRSNTVIIVNQDDVTVVDTPMSPSWARDVIALIRQLTDKPVRYVIYTHWHPDHVNGSQAYFAAFPKVQFIGQVYEREDMAHLVNQRNTDVRNAKNEETLKGAPIKFGAPAAIAEMEKQLAAGKGPDGSPLNEKTRADLKDQIGLQKGYLAELPKIRPILPTLTYENELVLHEGGRDIYLYHAGKAHTRGDTFVYLPKERVMITGDLVFASVPGGHDGYPVEYAKTLEAVDKYDWTVAIPGHNEIQQGKAQLEKAIFYLNDMVAAVKVAVDKGMTLEQTEKAVDLSAHATDFPGGFKNGNYEAIARAWAEMTKQPKSINGEPFLKD